MPVPSPLAQPWAITPGGFELVLSVWSRGALFLEARERALQARDGQPLENTHETTVRDGVAVIPVYGPLMRHASLFDAISGATSYSTIRKDLQKALDDPAVHAVILDINSPGGEVDGCAELADAIVAARGLKPIEVYVGGMGASAAYWLSSAGARITCAETALLGSIGVRLAMFDDSAASEKAGIRQVEIISSQSPGKRDRPMDDAVIARAQVTVDALAEVFIRKVAAQRGRSVEDVLANFGQGDVMVGQAAVDAGLADRLGSLEGLIEELSERRAPAVPQQHRGAAAFAPAPRSSSRKANAAVRPAAPKGATQMAKHMDPTKAKTRTALRADGAPPEPMPEGSEEEKCAHCEGSGTNPDGSQCETCGGSGGAKAEEDPEHMGDEADGDPEGAEDEGDMGAEEDEDKKEKAALARLAARHGLPAGASRAEILMAASAAPAATSLDATVSKLVADKFAAESKKKAAADAKEQAKQLVAQALKGGYAAEDRDALMALATSSATGMKAAERIAAPFIAKARKLYSQIGNAGSLTADNRAAAALVEKRLPSGIKKISYTGDLSAMAKALQAKEPGLEYEAALDRVMKTREGKAAYQQYMEQLS